MPPSEPKRRDRWPEALVDTEILANPCDAAAYDAAFSRARNYALLRAEYLAGKEVNKVRAFAVVESVADQAVERFVERVNKSDELGKIRYPKGYIKSIVRSLMLEALGRPREMTSEESIEIYDLHGLNPEVLDILIDLKDLYKGWIDATGTTGEVLLKELRLASIQIDSDDPPPLSSVAPRAGVSVVQARVLFADLIGRHISRFGTHGGQARWKNKKQDAVYISEIISHMRVLVEHLDCGRLFEIREHTRYLAVEGARVRFWESDERTWNGSLVNLSEMGLRFEIRIDAPDSEPELEEGEDGPHEGLDTRFELIPPSGPTDRWSRIPGTVIRRTREGGNLTYRVRLAEPVPPDLLEHLREDRP